MTPETFATNATPGAVLHGVSTDECGMHFDVWIKERSDVIARYPEDAGVEWRAGALVWENVLLVVLMFRVAYREEFYEMFLDFFGQHPDGVLPHYFELLSCEETVHLHFFGDAGELEYLLTSYNSLRPFFSDITQQAVAMKPWTRKEFEEARNGFAAEFPEKGELWEHLASAKPCPTVTGKGGLN